MLLVGDGNGGKKWFESSCYWNRDQVNSEQMHVYDTVVHVFDGIHIRQVSTRENSQLVVQVQTISKLSMCRYYLDWL